MAEQALWTLRVSRADGPDGAQQRGGMDGAGLGGRCLVSAWTRHGAAGVHCQKGLRPGRRVWNVLSEQRSHRASQPGFSGLFFVFVLFYMQ